MNTFHHYNRLIIAFFLLTFSLNVYSQGNVESECKVIRAIQFKEKKGDNIIVFLHVRTFKKEDFPPVLSMKLGYKYGLEGDEKVVDIMAQKKVSIIIYGDNMDTKMPKYYEAVKDKITIKPNEWVLCFRFTDVPKKDFKNRMSITYGLWDKFTQSERHEQNFVFTVDTYEPMNYDNVKDNDRK
jgi:hypothetical protein